MLNLINDNPTVVITILGWVISELLPFVPGPYNGIVQGIIQYLSKR